MINRLLLWLRPAILTLSLAAICISGAARATPQQTVAFTNAGVLNDTFDAVSHDQTILVRGDRIVAVGPSAEITVPQDAEVIDLSGQTVIPGLWDAHVHTRYEGIDHLRLLLIHGVTTLRDLGGPWEHLDRLTTWRQEIASGERLGPTIWTGGTVLNNPGANWAHITVVNTPEESRAAVRRLRAEGADFVKVYSNLTPENYAAIFDEARLQGLPVDGHLPLSIAPEEASQAGQRAIEHVDSLIAALSAIAPEMDSRGRPLHASLVGQLDPEKIAQLARLFVENGTHIVPTLYLQNHFIRLADPDEAVRDNPALRFIPQPYLDEWSAYNRAPDLEEWQASALLSRQVTLAMHRQGVPIIAGTDTVKPYLVPGDALHDELASLVEAGLTEGEAIRAATLAPAQMMGADDSGAIRPGYVADLLVLNGDPLDDIANTRDIAIVVRAGRVLDREELDRMADDMAAAAAQWQGLPSGRDR